MEKICFPNLTWFSFCQVHAELKMYYILSSVGCSVYSQQSFPLLYNKALRIIAQEYAAL